LNKVLIIKIGHSETLDPEISNKTSYGDVMRTTVLLHLYRSEHVSWLVDEKAYPILKGNEHIDRVLIYSLTTVLQLQAERFDTVINLEKVPGICALADSIKAWRRYGFRFDERTGEAEAYDGSQSVLSMCRDPRKKQTHTMYWQQRLYEMVGATWQGEEYILGYQPKSAVTHDVGFNYQVGNKWPSKMWPMEHWQELERLIGGRYSVSWQQGLSNMEEYFDWINSCRLIVTNDSFGLHLALAMKKRTIGLFGPTNHRELYLYNRGKILAPGHPECNHLPCNQPQCRRTESCLARIRPADVLAEIDRMLQSKGETDYEADPAAQDVQLRRGVSYAQV